MKVLVTGAAGFIGSKISFMLASRGDEVVGLDNINDYYDVRLKAGRLQQLGIDTDPLCNLPWNTMLPSQKFGNLRFIRLGIEQKEEAHSPILSAITALYVPAGSSRSSRF